MSRKPSLLLAGVLLAVALIAISASPAGSSGESNGPIVGQAVAFDVSPPLTVLARERKPPAIKGGEVRPDRGPVVADHGFSGSSVARQASVAAPNIPAPLTSFEGLSNQDNFNVFGGRVNPPDPVGDVSRNYYVEMINLVFGIYNKSGTLLLGPLDIGTLWAGFSVPDCSDPSGDPIVVYDQLADRWLLSQFTTSGDTDPNKPYWNCVAISKTSNPTGQYYRYAFETKNFKFFPDYPKYGVWKDAYVITTREFGPTTEYGIGVYALQKSRMLKGKANPQVVSFFLDGNDPDILPLIGDGLLPADLDGTRRAPAGSAIPLVGTQDDGGPYGATFDALNIWDLKVQWETPDPIASLTLNTQLPTLPFDSIFPCAPDSRDCLPQPGITNPDQFLDILSYRQRPTWRLAYRNFGDHETMVTNQSVEAAPATAGIRWYEIRRAGTTYSIYQQGDYAPPDGVHRWMGSIAQDKEGNMGLGYSVVNATTVFPGIRYTGRLANDPLGTMPLGEGTIINGSGVQTTTNSRWGDYTSMNIDPRDDCTFWYVNEYYTAAGQASSPAGWQTRIGSFKIC